MNISTVSTHRSLKGNTCKHQPLQRGKENCVTSTLKLIIQVLSRKYLKIFTRRLKSSMPKKITYVVDEAVHGRTLLISL